MAARLGVGLRAGRGAGFGARRSGRPLGGQDLWLDRTGHGHNPLEIICLAVDRLGARDHTEARAGLGWVTFLCGKFIPL